MQAEIIALRHQLTVLQRTQIPKRLVLNRGDDSCGFGCHDCGRVGVPLSSSLSLKPLSAGIVKDFAGIGLGRFVMVGPDDLVFRKKRAVSFEQ